jgi:hypothetical protein
MRMLTATREYMAIARGTNVGSRPTAPADLHRRFGRLFREIDHFCVTLVSKQIDEGTSARLGNVQGRQKVLELLEDSLHQLSGALVERPRGGTTLEPFLENVVETLDFLLLKPADAQFLVSTAKFEPWRVMDLAGAVAVLAYAFHLLGHPPRIQAVLLAGALLLVAVLVLYALWILVVSAAFWVVKVDNLSYLFGSLFDAGRWPIAIFRGVLWFAFTFIFPLALMTSYPAMALLDRLDARTALAAVVGGLAFASVARLVWRRALGFYTSASS